MADESLLTPLEFEAMDLTAQLANLIGRIVGDGPSRNDDINEFVVDIHHIQSRIMAQAASRAFPGRFRSLGGNVGGSTANSKKEDGG